MVEQPGGRGSRSARRTRSFGATVLLGLACAALTAVAGSQEWASGSGDAAGTRVEATVSGSDAAPLVVALALAALAAWGVILVTRGQVRRVLAVVGLVAALGVLATVLLSFGSTQDAAVEALMDRGATGDVFRTRLTGWYYVTGVAALGTAVALGVAVVRSPGWPAMGERYDAPAARREQPATDEDLWRALDEGRDPTS